MGKQTGSNKKKQEDVSSHIYLNLLKALFKMTIDHQTKYHVTIMNYKETSL